MEQNNNSATHSANETSVFGQYKKYIFGGIAIIAVIFFIFYPIHVYNYCQRTEVNVLAMQNACKINMAQAMTQTKLSDKVLTREEKKLIEAMNIAVSRYDNIDGAFMFVQEQNLQVSAESYQQVRQTMEIYYAKFYAKQEALNDMARAYESARSTFFFGTTARILGFPKQKYIDARVDQMILEKGVNNTYDSKDRTMPDIPLNEGTVDKIK